VLVQPGLNDLVEAAMDGGKAFMRLVAEVARPAACKDEYSCRKVEPSTHDAVEAAGVTWIGLVGIRNLIFFNNV
jgi:hypothetical protein